MPPAAAVRVVPALEDVPAAVAAMARPGDLVITLGAGSIGGTGERILEAIRHRRAQPAAAGGTAMRVKAPAEKNFRRARAEAGAAPAAARARSPGASHGRCSSSSLIAFAGYRAASLRLPLEPVPGEPGSRARQRADLERGSAGDRARSPGHPHPHRQPDRVAPPAARVALARRGRAAPGAAVDDRRVRVRAPAVRPLPSRQPAVPRRHATAP